MVSTALLLGICFFVGSFFLFCCVPANVVVEIGEGEKEGFGGKRWWNERRVTNAAFAGGHRMGLRY